MKFILHLFEDFSGSQGKVLRFGIPGISRVRSGLQMIAAERREEGGSFTLPLTLPFLPLAPPAFQIEGESAGPSGGHSLISIFQFPRCSCLGAKEREGWSGHRELRGREQRVDHLAVGGRERKRVHWCVEFDALGYPGNLADRTEAW